MSLFGSIMDKIFHHPSTQAGPAQDPATQSAPAPPSPSSAATPVSAATAPSPPVKQVDVDDVLNAMAQSKGGGGNYQTSIVDLLKLLDLDSSIEARKTLAEELGVHVGAYDSAEQNVALHKAVMTKLAENGGNVPNSMKG